MCGKMAGVFRGGGIAHLRSLLVTDAGVQVVTALGALPDDLLVIF